MSAPALNAAFPTSPGLTAGAGAGASQLSGEAKGPTTGFEALLATFFGAEPQPGTVAPGAKTKTGQDTGVTGLVLTDGDSPAVGDVAIAKTPEDIKATEAAAAALAAYNAGLGLPVAAAPIAAPPTPAIDKTEAKGEAAVVGGASKGSAKAVAPAFPDEALLLEVADTGPGSADPKTGADQPVADPNPASGHAKLAFPAQLKAEAPTPSIPPPAQPKAAAAAVEPLPVAPVRVDTAALAVAVAVQGTSQVAAKVVEETAPATAAPIAGKDKAQGAKPARGEHTRADAEPPAALVKANASMAAAAADGAAKGGAEERPAQASAADTKAETADAPRASADVGVATASTTNASTLVHPGLIPVRGSPQTVANLAAQIAKKLEGRSTRFDLELNPQGLGRVDVRMEIGATGRMSAAMTFDTPAAAAELRARANELQRHLEQAGFDLSGGLSFDVAGDRGQGRQAQQQHSDSDTGQAFRGRAFQQALATADEAAQSAVSGALNLRRSLISGVDVRI